MTGLVVLAALLLAFANGANDNPKGVATLIGARVLSFRSARALATVSTGLGALVSVSLANALVQAFSGKGLVPDSVLTPSLLAAAGLGAAATVGVATLRGLPVSTTHALVGALVGAGLATAGDQVALAALGRSFALPLLLGPLLALAVSWLLLRGGKAVARGWGLGAQTCVCVEETWLPETSHGVLTRAPLAAPRLVVDDTSRCRAHDGGWLAGVAVEKAISRSHLGSAALVGFARGLNDTPKILGLMVGAGIGSLSVGAAAIALAMATGGWVAARRVTRTLAHDITELDPAQGLAGNLATSLLVIGASHLGLPVSTTHVSAGGIFGVGVSTGTVRRRIVMDIVGAWVLTLPTAALFAAVASRALPALP